MKNGEIVIKKKHFAGKKEENKRPLIHQWLSKIDSQKEGEIKPG